jgi:hypothetical protein
MTTRFEIDEHGFPIVLADVPNAGASTTDPDAASGNPEHDVNSGKFAPGTKEGGEPVTNVPPHEDAQAYLRQLDAVRDLAREMDDVEAGDIQDLLAGRLTRPLAPEELEAFIAQVRVQRLNDLVDLLDHQFRNLLENVKRGRRKVKITAPRGWVRKVFNGLTDDEVLSVVNRLEARGHSREDLQRTVLGRIRKKDRADAIGARLAEIPENDSTLALSFNDIDGELDVEGFEDTHEMWVKLAETIANKQQEIIVNVNVENKPTKKIVKRDKTGMITSVEEVQDA